MQQQGLFELPLAINELTELEILKLSANHLNSAPPHFEETLQSLQVLWLKNCEVQELDNRWVAHNPLRVYHAIHPSTATTFRSPPLLMHNLVSTLITWFPRSSLRSIGVLHHLKHLDLEDNHISALPEHFVRLRKLETLNLSKNKLFDLPDDLGKLTALKEVWHVRWWHLPPSAKSACPDPPSRSNPSRSLALSPSRSLTLSLPSSCALLSTRHLPTRHTYTPLCSFMLTLTG